MIWQQKKHRPPRRFPHDLLRALFSHSRSPPPSLTHYDYFLTTAYTEYTDGGGSHFTTRLTPSRACLKFSNRARSSPVMLR